jgi:steroid 5-alpha reductase family enzyme
MNAGLAFFIGALFIGFMFFISWLWAVRCDNYSLVDAVWAFGIGFISCVWLLAKGDFSPKCLIAMVLIVAWSLRLGIHLERRIRRTHPVEDARYAKLREVWIGRERSAFFWFFQGQALSVILLALPFMLIAIDKDRAWSLWESLGLAVSLIGIFGESLADAQMSRFKSKTQDSSAVCQDGLWYYSRHPNYFFEALIWIGFYIYTCGSEWGWLMVYAPAMIIYLLLRVTGIPPTEAAALLRKGDAYRRYQASTSPFVPWPPKKN